MKYVFWVSLVFLAYTYFGYPAWLWMRSHWRARPVLSGDILPAVSVIVAVHNGEAYLERKLDNMVTNWDYPSDRIEIIVVSDGSTDRTNAILQQRSDKRIRAVFTEQREGKAAAINRAVPLATGEIVVFTDVRQTLEREAVRRLVSAFADPSVGCASGRLMLNELDLDRQDFGEGAKVALENKIREWEGATSSIIGALGAFYAVRREAIGELPKGTILDDCYIPLNAVLKGWRSVFDTNARAWDDIQPTIKQEFLRKVRTLTGNYQLLQLMPAVLSTNNPVLFEFISHKVLRLIIPFAHVAAFVTSALIREPFYQIICVGQLIVCGVALLGVVPGLGRWMRRVSGIPLTLMLLNFAAVVALLNFLRRKENVWVA